MTAAIVALGSNIEPRRDTIMSGVAAIAKLPGTRLRATSPLRHSEPVGGPPDAPPFLNGACLLQTELGPHRLLDALLAIEDAHGRVRGEPDAPRTLDLDLILYGDLVLEEDDIVIPHPRAHERLFVLEPAADLAPYLVHPKLDETLAKLLERVRAEQAAENTSERRP